MDIRKLSLDEYMSRKQKSYLECCLENGTAEYYIVNYNNKEYPFFFYKNNNIADISLNEKLKDSLLDYEKVMQDIFKLLKNMGYKEVRITLFGNNYLDRNAKALLYGFEEFGRVNQNGQEFIKYKKEL